MAEVKFTDGTVINFKGDPSPQDIEEAYNQVKGIETEQPKDSFGRFLYRENISPLASGVSTMAFGIPRDIARAYGKEELIFPEQRTWQGKALRGVAETGGFLKGGPGSFMKKAGEVIPKLATESLRRKALRAGAEGLVGGISTSGTPEERLKTGGTFGALSFATPYALQGLKKSGQIITKSGRWVAKNIGGITDASVKVIKDLGVDRVFDPLKAKADYISQNIAPRVYNKLTNFVKTAHDAYSKAVNSAPEGKSINIRPAIEKAGDELKQLGLITQKGNLTELGNSEIAKDSVYGKLLDFYQSANAISGVEKLQGKDLTQSQMVKAFKAMRETKVNKKQFIFFRDKLNALYKNKSSDIDVSGVRDAFYKSGEDAGMEGLNIAKSLENKVFDIEDKIDIKKITSNLVKAKNPQWTKVIDDEYKDLVKKGIITEKDYKNIYDDLMAHFSNIDFNLISETPGAGGGFYPSKSGFLRSGVAGASKGYYKFVEPQLQKVSPLTSAFGRFLSRDYPLPQIGIGRGISEMSKE